MSMIRRDAIGPSGSGAYSVIITHCDGAVRLDGGPCKCSDGGCWLALIPCNCENFSQMVFLPFTAEVEAAWPYADRRAGTVIRINGRCYRYLGSTDALPGGATEIGFAGFEDVYSSCDDSPCNTDPACPPCSGGFTARIRNGVGMFGFVRFPCAGAFEIDCVATIAVEYSAIATWRVDAPGLDVGTNTDEQEGRIEQTITAVLDGITTAQSYTITERSSGYRFSTIDGTPVRDTSWDYTGNYADTDPDPIVGNIAAEIYNRTVFEPLVGAGNLIANGFDAPEIVEAYGFSIPQSSGVFGNASQVCNGTYEETNTSGQCPITNRGSSEVAQTPTSSTASLFGEVEDLDLIGGNCELRSRTTFTHEVAVRRVITLVDGTVLDFTSTCELEDPDGGDGGGGGGGGGGDDGGGPVAGGAGTGIGGVGTNDARIAAAAEQQQNLAGGVNPQRCGTCGQ